MRSELCRKYQERKAAEQRRKAQEAKALICAMIWSAVSMLVVKHQIIRNIPQDNRRIFSSSASVFPRATSQLDVDSSTDSSISAGLAR